MKREYTPEECCQVFWRTYHKVNRGINIRTIKNFDKQKKDVKKWTCFEHLAIVATKYQINIYDYIPMVAAKSNGKFFQPAILLKPYNLQIWTDLKKKQKEVANYEKIANEFTKSISWLVNFCVENELNTFKEYLEATLKSHQFGIHCISGKLSKYFICFIPNLYKLTNYIEPDIAHQIDHMIVRHVDALKSNTYTAMKEMKNVEIKSIMKIVDHNIQRKMV